MDNSAYSMKAAMAGFAVAHALKASTSLLYVVDRSKEIVNADLGITAKQSETILLNEAEQTIEQYIRLYNGIESIEKFTPECAPENEIINIAEQWNIDMIVMGTHARTGLQRMITSSLAEYVIRHSKIPVLVTPAHVETA